MSPRMPDPTDRALAERVVEEGDEGAFRTLYRRHTPYLYQLVLRTLGGNEADGEDVVQETWIRAAENLDGFRWEGSLRSWLSGIAMNLCRNLFRRRNRGWLVVREDLHPAPRGDPEGRIDVEEALRLLADGYRTVLLLHDLEGYKHREIAEMLGTSVGTSKSQLFHARRALAQLIEPETRDTRKREHA